MQIVTPRGWKSDRAASRYLFLVGRNSRTIAVSIGMFPPSPKPMKQANTLMPTKLLGAAVRIPKTPVMRQVRLNAHFRPMTSAARP